MINNVKPEELKPAVILKRYGILANLYSDLKARASNCTDEALRKYANELPNAEDANLPRIEPLSVAVQVTDEEMPQPKKQPTAQDNPNAPQPSAAPDTKK